MSDRAERARARSAAPGDLEAEARTWVERLRRGEVEGDAVELRAAMGEPAARLAWGLTAEGGPDWAWVQRVCAPGRLGRMLRDGTGLVWIPPGRFLMGANSRFSEEVPEREVELTRGFWLGRTQVTQAQYARYCAETGSRSECLLEVGEEDHPVAVVTWEEARDYCAWVGGRLPTEAEWEWAARGPDGRAFPWGDTEDRGRANWRAGGTTPVGSFPGGASPFGCLDMSGNLWDWCVDWFADYRRSDRVDPQGPSVGEVHVSRGGCWGILPVRCRCAARNREARRGYAGPNVGFRVAVSVDASEAREATSWKT